MQKKKKPVLTSVDLTANIEHLYDAMVKFRENMFKQASRTASKHVCTKPVRSVKDNWSIRSLPIGVVEQEMQFERKNIPIRFLSVDSIRKLHSSKTRCKEKLY